MLGELVERWVEAVALKHVSIIPSESGWLRVRGSVRPYPFSRNGIPPEVELAQPERGLFILRDHAWPRDGIVELAMTHWR
ncbi:hypothetical protein R75465_07928 [Paraburkholderia aspalathi]|nr:hypothetical protein R75465_07928 [Paraburkholderia aspalathi]